MLALFVPRGHLAQEVISSTNSGDTVSIESETVNSSSDPKLGDSEQDVQDLVDDGVEQPEEVPVVNQAIQKRFLQAIVEEDYNSIVTALKMGADLNYSDNFLQLPLKLAVDGRNIVIIKHLIREGADPDVKFSLGGYNQAYETTLLIYAVKLGYSEVVLALLDSNANPNLFDSNNKSAFFIAAEKGSRKDIIRLKNAGANHFIKDKKTGLAAAHVAIRKGHGHIFELLYEIDNRFLTLPDKGGRLPIHYAAAMNDSDTLNFILEQDITKVNAADSNNRVPLHYAAGKGNVSSIKSLILAGAEVNAVDKWNMNSLHFAVMSKQPDAANILIQAGVSPYIKDKIKGDTPLDIAQKKNMTDIIPVLQSIKQ